MSEFLRSIGTWCRVAVAEREERVRAEFVLELNLYSWYIHLNPLPTVYIQSLRMSHIINISLT